MGTCEKKNIIYICIKLSLILIICNFSYADVNFSTLRDKKVSYLDFFLLKFENKLISRSRYLSAQLFATRVQYSNIGVQVNFDKKENFFFTDIYAVMDKNRYDKKKYQPKLRDCNQVRNLIFYRKHGYGFFTQKRNSSLSQDIMEEIFKEVFFRNLDFTEKEINFILSRMFVKVTVFHPIKKTELICSGKINDYELK